MAAQLRAAAQAQRHFSVLTQFEDVGGTAGVQEGLFPDCAKPGPGEEESTTCACRERQDPKKHPCG